MVLQTKTTRSSRKTYVFNEHIDRYLRNLVSGPVGVSEDIWSFESIIAISACGRHCPTVFDIMFRQEIHPIFKRM